MFFFYLHAECEKCTPLQASFLKDLRKRLKACKTLGSAVESLVEDAVREYVQKFIKAGSTSVDHLHEHLQPLYNTEYLISNPKILDMAKALADALMKPSLPVPVPLVHSLSLTPESKPLFSKPVVYHASVCCLAVNKCTHSDCSTYFKDEIGHSFKEVSISQSEQGRYLIAIQDSTYYIAFQSETNISQWPKKYQSLSKGICCCHTLICL